MYIYTHDTPIQAHTHPAGWAARRRLCWLSVPPGRRRHRAERHLACPPGGSSPSGDQRGWCENPVRRRMSGPKTPCFPLGCSAVGAAFGFCAPTPGCGFRSAAGVPDPVAVPRAERSAGATARPFSAVHRGPDRGGRADPAAPPTPSRRGGGTRRTTRRSYHFSTSRLRQVWRT